MVEMTCARADLTMASQSDDDGKASLMSTMHDSPFISKERDQCTQPFRRTTNWHKYDDRVFALWCSTADVIHELQSQHMDSIDAHLGSI